MAKKSERKLTLEQCTKDELIWLIHRILYRATLNQHDYYLECALNDLWFEREMKHLAKAEELAAHSIACREEYGSLLAPYEGKPMIDIPLEVLQKARDLLEQAERADRMWNRLMGIENIERKRT